MGDCLQPTSSSAIHPFNLFWQLTFWLWVPLIKLLPKSVWEGWLFIMLPDWEFITRQEHFQRLGSESFIVVSPLDLTLFTNHPGLMHQIASRREAFPKDTARYGVLEMFGKNVVTTEGAVWRMHRKVTSASFNEKNAAFTFAEAIRQTHGMIGMWFGKGIDRNGDSENADSTKTITTLEHDTQKWALNIFGYVGFGLRLRWPGQELPQDTDPKLAKYGSLEAPPGYTMSFPDSLGLVLEKIVTLLIFPWWLLRFLPFEFAKTAWSAKENYVKFMAEFLEDKKDDIRLGNVEKEGMDIMGQLVRAKYDQGAEKESIKLDDSDIIGNAFMISVAGHETTANAVHLTLVELACNPTAQRRIQKDIDDLFGDSDPSTWDYEKSVNPMLASYIGACANETLRKMPSVVVIPKVVSADADQTVVVDGTKHVLPARMSIALMAFSVHRNPRWWPTKPSERTGTPTDLDDYLPERWYRASKIDGEAEENHDDGADYGGYQGSDTSAALYRPPRGSFVPFSDGPRSCLGRRIAMVEFIAALAVLFQRYSVELAVDEWASDKEMERMGAEERRELYVKAQKKGRATLDKANTIITLKLNSGKFVPVRLVRRGKERFIRDLELV
ncbi:cytochrome P450 [Bombardia bombarda]|uniref:Cytochrome P450 n=1 Tax=Bombardia bombarda TaxID=252184 RepID=A0AA40CES7_9PEZI|nr:cytochrome P450 [Bombardia bombarda]